MQSHVAMYFLIGGFYYNTSEMRQLHLRACTLLSVHIHVLHALNRALHVSISTLIYRVIAYEGVTYMRITVCHSTQISDFSTVNAAQFKIAKIL